MQCRADQTCPLSSFEAITTGDVHKLQHTLAHLCYCRIQTTGRVRTASRAEAAMLSDRQHEPDRPTTDTTRALAVCSCDLATPCTGLTCFVSLYTIKHFKNYISGLSDAWVLGLPFLKHIK